VCLPVDPETASCAQTFRGDIGVPPLRLWECADAGRAAASCTTLDRTSPPDNATPLQWQIRCIQHRSED
jgi:hypothetical protein